MQKEKIRKNTLDWLKTFLPNYTDIQEEIFINWNERLTKHYLDIDKIDDTNFKNDSNFLLKKNLSLFFPYYYLSRSSFELPGILKAIEILKEAYHNKEKVKIVLFADRDVDGITAGTILYLFLRDQMQYPEENLDLLLPEEEDKYGITPEVAKRIQSKEPNIVITLDCGSSNKDTMEWLKENCKKLSNTIILDHHFIPELKEDYPKVDAFINPKRLSTSFSERDLCTAGLALKLIWSLTYSFSSDFNKTYKIQTEDKPYFIRNGVLLLESDEKSCFDVYFQSNQESTAPYINAEKLWNEEITKNKTLKKLDNFISEHKEAISSWEKFRILQNLRFKNIKQKIIPYLPLAAIGTIGDMMPLVDDNRILVYEGMQKIRQNHSDIPVGLRQLMKSLLQVGTIVEKDISFLICPTINAAGRMGMADKASSLLLEKDNLTAAKKSFELKKINEKRKKLTLESISMLEKELDEESSKNSIIVAYEETIHRGISGLIAGKLSDKYSKPAVVLVNDGDCLRGSIRAFQNEDVYSLLLELKDLFIQFGGHKQAAGFSLEYEKLSEFKKQIYQLSKEKFRSDDSASIPSSYNQFHPPLAVAEKEVNIDLWKQCLVFAPYGILNPHPLVSISSSKSFNIQSIGKDNSHAKVDFEAITNQSIEGVWFFHGNKIDTIEKKSSLSWIVEPHINYFRGKVKYQLQIKDVISNLEMEV